MKLYFSPGACSLSPHIALQESGLSYEIEQVNLKDKVTKGGADFKKINPKGYVPTLQLDDGTVLTEGPAIVQYIADKKADAKLAPPAGTAERYRLQEWLNFISTEIHKGMSPLFNPKTPDAYKEMVNETLAKRFDFLSKALDTGPFLMGNQFTVADGYLFTVLNWTGHLKIELGKWPVLKAYHERVGGRPAVREAMKAEGLLK